MSESVRNQLNPDKTVTPHASQVAQCWVSFGGNVGNVRATFDAALALLSLHCHIQLGRRSGLYSTVPMGTQSGSPFLNSICELKTSLSPCELLKVLQSVENQLGRVRDVRWGPRTLDLDLLSHGGEQIDTPDLIIPHPGLTYRRFILDPLVEVDSNWLHPIFHVNAGQLRLRLDARPLPISITDVSQANIETVAERLEKRFPQVRLVDGTCSENLLLIQTAGKTLIDQGLIVDLRRSPGDLLEQLSSALTAMFDVPERVSDW